MPPRMCRAVDVFDVVYLVLTLLPPSGALRQVYRLGSSCRPLTLSRARRVNRLWADASDHVISMQFNPSRVFSPFFRSIPGFRALMACYNVIASGSRILALFDTDTAPFVTHSTGLDLLVEQCDAPYLNRYLHHEGYVVVADSSCNPCVLASTPYSRAPQVENFPYRSLFELHRRFVLRVTRWFNGTHVIDVICTAWTPVMAVFHFATTADMNFMSWDKVFCLFPALTVIHKIAAVPGARYNSALNVVAKREARGFSVQVWHESSSAVIVDSLQQRCRWLGDSMSWSIALDDDGMPDGYGGDRQWQANGLQISHAWASGPYLRDQSPQLIVRLAVSPLEHASLSTHTYAVPPFIVSKFETLVRRYIFHGELDVVPYALPRLLAWYQDGDSDSDGRSESSDSSTEDDSSW
ncbi:hypothetical protein AURDEDRAFT_161780 [Auricularia subglabra TFB-10046 SS5]|nr:hypothetical protein AURDEDRAFT_161780 [Auricularia subglabra TFB-10046 SS5]